MLDVVVVPCSFGSVGMSRAALGEDDVLFRDLFDDAPAVHGLPPGPSGLHGPLENPPGVLAAAVAASPAEVEDSLFGPPFDDFPGVGGLPPGPSGLHGPLETPPGVPGAPAAASPEVEVAPSPEDTANDLQHDPTAMAALFQARMSIPGAASSTADFAALWTSVLEAYSNVTAHGVRTPLGTAHTILLETARVEGMVEDMYSTWSRDLVRLAAGALHCYKKRLVDLSERDNVHLLWVCCGGDLVRAHGGVVYIFDPIYGSWNIYEGIVPQHVLHQARRMGLIIEGMFRRFPSTLPRKDVSVLEAIDALIGSRSFEEFCDACVMASVWNQGERTGGAPLNPPGYAGADGEEAEGAIQADANGNGVVAAQGCGPWPILVARAVGKVTSQLVRNLEAGRLLNKFAEWCGQDMDRTKGVAFKDCVVLYDVAEDTPITFSNSRAASNNIYVKIQHDLLRAVDPVLMAAVGRLQKAYQQTFWANVNGFKFGQACLALASRGLNVNQITVYWGPGGVGMSSFTAHLAAMYGDQNHVMFDPNVFYDDTELRKTVERFMGKFIYTGQEKPVGTKQGVRQDLVKKFATGEGISGRMPYGVITKLFRVIGWKRVELNSMINFEGIEEASFESILRRFAVITLHSRLVERGTLEGVPFDSATGGVFERDPDLEAFYVSGPGTAAGLMIQLGFERAHNLEACRAEIIHYTRQGGDNGVGLAYMREACGLKPLAELHSAPGSTLGPLGFLLQPDAEQTTELERVRHASLTTARHMSTQGFDFLTSSSFARLNTVHATSGMLKEVLWRRFKESAYWRDAGKKKKAMENLQPVLPTDRPVTCLYAAPADVDRPADALGNLDRRDEAAPVLTLVETFDVSRLRDYLEGSAARKANHAALTEALVGQLAEERARRPRGQHEESAEMVQIRKRLNSLRTMEQVGYEVLARSEAALETEAGADAGRAPQQGDFSRSRTGESKVSHTVAYPPKLEFRSRRYASKTSSAQGMDQRLQKLLLHDTVDLDIANCMPVLLHQMVDRVKLVDREAWQSELDLLREIATNRQAFCEQRLKMPVSEGKRVLAAMLQGQAARGEVAGKADAQRIIALGRFLRWLACSLAPRVYSALKGSEDPNAKKWPEASTLAYLWQGVEDHVLEVMLQFVRGQMTEHVSMHFDGLRVDRGRVRLEAEDGGDGVREMCARLQDHVLERTGYAVQIVSKEHLSFMELLRGVGGEPLQPPPPAHMLGSENCIPLALGAVLGDSSLWNAFGPAAPVPGSQAGRPRAYRDVAADMGVQLVPELDLYALAEGKWLLHSENGGRPHCVAVQVQSRQQSTVYWSGRSAVLGAMRLQGLLHAALDRKTIVLFRVYVGSEPVPAVRPHLFPLLDMLTEAEAAA